MASKSKKRRRVLGASCILAALIIAGSSFAWFTSKDEVTNRLSASGDYGVSIVESFAPPEKWLPGQEINKDVYAVNTGDVDAFVKETVSGVLTITTEEAYTTDNKKPVPGESIELSSAERYVKEAGSFLVYKPTGSEKELGTEIVSMTPGATEDDYASEGTTDFTPDVEGLYVFRRTIAIDPTTKAETYTYDAYYFVPGRDATPAYEAVGNSSDADYKPAIEAQPAVPGKYYKVSNLKTTLLDPTTKAGDNVQDDGIVVADPAPTYGFYRDVTKTVVPTLTYDAAKNRLVATYDTSKSLDELKTLAKNYEDASIAYEDALEELNAALRDQGNGTTGASGALAQAKQNLEDAIDALNTAKTNMDDAWDDYDTALQESVALNTAWNDAKKNLQDAKDALGTSSDSSDKDTLYGKLKKADEDLVEATNAANTKKNERDSALAARNAAQTDVNNTTDDQHKAFLDAVIAKANSDATIDDIDTTDLSTARTAAQAYVDNLTYAQMQALGIENGDPGWAYYQKLLELKDKQEKLDAAEAAYQAALQAKTNANNAKLAAQEAVDAKEAQIGSVGDGRDPDNTNDGTLTAIAEIAEDAYIAKMEKLYGDTDGANYGVNGSTEDGKYTDDSLYGTYKAKEALYNDENRNYAEKLAAYNEAAGDAGNADNNVAAARTYVAQTKKAMDEAKKAYEDATTSLDAKKLKIYINLADVTTTGGVANKWQLLPDSLEDKFDNEALTAGTDTITDTASFYYTSILGGGKTTSKLIDSVVLDDQTTQDMFKYFDFDLNVTLNSSQVNIDSNGNYTAETAEAELGKNATLSVPNANAVVTWSEDANPIPATPAAATQYTTTISGTQYIITELNTPKSIDYTDYEYEITSGEDKYYGHNYTAGTTFKKLVNGELVDEDALTLSTTATTYNP